jgi:spore cortex biosynthesis protein YabQ
MIVSVSDQVYIFFCTILGGMAIGFLYDIFRITRRTVKTGKTLIYIEDLLFWVFSAVLMSVIIYYCNSGELRFYMFLGALLGAVLYELLFSRIIINASIFILNLLFKVLKTIISVVSYPFRFLYGVLKTPVKKLICKIKAAIRKAKADRIAKAMSKEKERRKPKAKSKKTQEKKKEEKGANRRAKKQNEKTRKSF